MTQKVELPKLKSPMVIKGETNRQTPHSSLYAQCVIHCRPTNLTSCQRNKVIFSPFVNFTAVKWRQGHTFSFLSMPKLI